MDCVRSIPKRASSYCTSMSIGLKPSSLGNEVSIPKRDSNEIERFLPLPVDLYDTG